MKFKLVEDWDRLEEKHTSLYNPYERFSTEIFKLFGVTEQVERGQTELKKFLCNLVNKSDYNNWCIHHIDKNVDNYEYTNLALMHQKTHNNYHVLLRQLFDVPHNPMQQLVDTCEEYNIPFHAVKEDMFDYFVDTATHILRAMPDVCILSDVIEIRNK